MSALQKKIDALEARIQAEQQVLRVSSLIVKRKLSSKAMLVSTIVGSIGLGFFLVRHPRTLAAKIKAAPGFFLKAFKHAEMLLPFIL